MATSIHRGKVSQIFLSRPKRLTLIRGHLQCQHLSTTKTVQDKMSYKVVVVGGGSGGCSMAAKFARKLGSGKVAIIEPHEVSF